MMKLKGALAALTLFVTAGCTDDPDQTAPVGTSEATPAYRVTEEMRLWPGVAPGSEGWMQQEITTPSLDPAQTPVVRNVVDPTLTAYLPDPAKATGSAVIVVPGGGFMMLAMDHEGHAVARWLAERGIAAFVLKYRLEETPVDDAAFTAQLIGMLRGVLESGEASAQTLLEKTEVGAADAVQAIRLVRERAAEWGYAPDRVGMMGFSAGAFITTRVAADPDLSVRPAFAAPIYGGSFGADAEIPKDLPPMFVTVAGDDDLLVDSTVSMVNRLRAAGYKPAFHLYPSGGHGFGMTPKGTASDHWIDQFYWWMEELGMLKR